MEAIVTRPRLKTQETQLDIRMMLLGASGPYVPAKESSACREGVSQTRRKVLKASRRADSVRRKIVVRALPRYCSRVFSRQSLNLF